MAKKGGRGCYGCLTGDCATITVIVVILLLIANLVYLAGSQGEGQDERGVAAAGAAQPEAAAEGRPGRLPLLARGSGPRSATDASPPKDVYEDNAPRPPPRPGDSEVVSLRVDAYPGADASHLHGKLPWVEPTPLPKGGLNGEEKRKAHRGQCYNSLKSDALPLDRDQPDRRSAACRRLAATYPPEEKLPSASIVIVFHNEIASALMRSVHSVLNHSPPGLLKEIILVDDHSETDPTRFTKEQLEKSRGWVDEHILQLPKVRVVRLGERRGLMLARMEGCWRASGEVTIFLDSHIEATEGWMQPLLARIKEDPRHVVVPSIDSIHFDNLSYEGGSGLGVLGFTWTLGQKPEAGPAPDSTQPVKSPIMAGGLFAAHRAFFLHLGGYDPEMRFYGGEEMEIGFRTWQCGGDIEFMPCSHVFHIFRNSVYWQGTDSGGVAYKVPAMDITRNKLRTARVWMDEYSKLVEYASPPLPKGMGLGNLTARRALREKLQCKPFSWYLQKVSKRTFVPEVKGLRAGALRNPKTDGCMDTMGGREPGLYPCHGQHGTQGFVMDGEGLIRSPVLMYEECLVLRNDKAQLKRCPQGGGKSADALWVLQESGQFSAKGGSLCLEASSQSTPRSPLSLEVAPCSQGEVGPEQRWEWMAW